MKPACKTGAAIATAVAALIATVAPPLGVASAEHAKGKCIGANACKARATAAARTAVPARTLARARAISS
jgi:hypothetical protein